MINVGTGYEISPPALPAVGGVCHRAPTLVGCINPLPRSQPPPSLQTHFKLLQFNAGLSAETQLRFDELVAKRQAETITPEDLAELIRLTEQSEQRDAQRVAALETLAQLRRMTLSDLMDSLGLSSPPAA